MNARLSRFARVLFVSCCACGGGSGLGAGASEGAMMTVPREALAPNERALVDAGAAGSRVGVHGMVLFGREKFYLSHIPMYRSPHDLQWVAEASIVSGAPVGQNFNGASYTLKPRSLSLTDLASGALRTVRGTVYKGNFEDGGVAQFDVELRVERVVYAEVLRPRSLHATNLTYVAVGTPVDIHLVHVIDDSPSFDQIVEATPSAIMHLAAADLQEGVRGALVGTANAVASRPKSPASVTFRPERRVTDGGASDAGADPNDETLTVGHEASCLLGAEFFNPCR